ncbi:unnamed protein product [Candida verbasci]|uniref:Uncharacterized protein n=1 Tax=Candida verbasci TaxID=1227364 RepID=A0A9W4TZS8_9ASCO|nr:unnamed protein product [Candida verbasci]
MSFTALNTTKDLDIISDLKLQSENRLLFSTWSNEIYLYSCQEYLQASQSSHIEPPKLSPLQVIKTDNSTPLSLLYHPSYQKSIVGALDGTISEIDYENNKLNTIVKNTEDTNNGVNKLCNIANNLIISSSFNGLLRLIDVRTHDIISQYKKEGKIFNIESNNEFKVIVTRSKNQLEIYDSRKGLASPIEIREVGLKYQIKDLKICNSDNNKFAISTIDGRVSIEYLNELNLDQRFTFKCHRTQDKITNTDLVYPVNSICFQNENYLYTGGSDGYVCLWDCGKKTRLKQFPQFRTQDNDIESISKIEINNDGNLLVVGTSDDSYYRNRRLSQSEDSKNPSKVYIKSI